MCPRARPVKAANGLPIPLSCFTPASYGNQVIWLHNNRPLPNKPWWVTSRVGRTGPHDTLEHHLKLSASLSDDSGNITCKVVGSGDGVQQHISASVDVKIGGKCREYSRTGSTGSATRLGSCFQAPTWEGNARSLLTRLQILKTKLIDRVRDQHATYFSK